MKDESIRDLNTIAFESKTLAKLAERAYNDDAEPDTLTWGDATACDVLLLWAGHLRRAYETIERIVGEEEAEAQLSAEKI